MLAFQIKENHYVHVILFDGPGEFSSIYVELFGVEWLTLSIPTAAFSTHLQLLGGSSYLHASGTRLVDSQSLQKCFCLQLPLESSNSLLIVR